MAGGDVVYAVNCLTTPPLSGTQDLAPSHPGSRKSCWRAMQTKVCSILCQKYDTAVGAIKEEPEEGQDV